MMNKEQFINRMVLIQNFHEDQDVLQTLIDKISDGYSIVTVGNKLVNEIINMIEEDIGYKNILNWWLYEDVDKVIYEKDMSKEYSVKTLGELYDYMVTNKN